MARTKVDTEPLPIAIIGRDTWADIVDYRPGLASESNRKLFAWSIWGGYLHHNESEHGRLYERVAVPERPLAIEHGTGASAVENGHNVGRAQPLKR